ncbi:MAG: T9SS type A sorting domain-containing protein [Bacteroidetes bacterium]|nr:T9SS type A sorting domain-containing protein [Bacteroidota bacterium]
MIWILQLPLKPTPIDFAQPFTVNADVINNGTNNFSGDFSAVLFTSTGDFVSFIQTLSASGSPLQPGYHYTGGLTFSSTGVLSVPGSYTIGIFYQDPGGNWNLAGTASFTNPESVNISSPVDYIQQNSPIVATPSTFVQGQPASVNVNMVNDNSATYYGQYAAALYDLNGNFVQTIGTYNETTGLPAGYTYNSPYITFNTAAITATPGTYILAIQELENGFSTWYLVGGDYYSTPINIDVELLLHCHQTFLESNTQPTSYTLPLNWSGNNAHPLTTGSNNHIGSDYDYYKINLASGYNYTITARAHDSYNSGNGITYTNDVLWSYDSGGGLSLAYDDVMPGNIIVNGSGTVYFQVAPYFAGQTGTYLMDINVNRVSTIGIEEISNTNLFQIYPNPASNVLDVKFADNVSVENLTIKNIVGQIVSENKFTSSNMEIDLSALSNGMYFLEAIENNKTYSVKFIINK